MALFKQPVYSGTVELKSGDTKEFPIENNVRIVRDKSGVPHVYAKSVRDLLFGQGFAQAQDRLWQMEFLRRYARGTVSEIEEDALPIDILSRTLGFYRLALEVRLLRFKKSKNSN